MEAGFIVYAFLLAGFISLCGVVFFVWMNRRDSQLDNRAYDDSFDPGRMVEKYRFEGKTDEEIINPGQVLKRYAQPATKVTISKPEESAEEISVDEGDLETKVTKETKVTRAKDEDSESSEMPSSSETVEQTRDELSAKATASRPEEFAPPHLRNKTIEDDKPSD